jgi:hypothetical protein
LKEELKQKETELMELRKRQIEIELENIKKSIREQEEREKV